MSLARNLARGASVSGGLAPTGVVLPFAGTAAPTGWLLCAGQSLLQADYPDLYAVIGNTYGSDATHFSLPDLRGRVPGGKDNMGGSAASRLTTAGSGVDGATLGAAGGAETHTLTTAQMPSHTHSVGALISGRNTSTGGGEVIMYQGTTTASGSQGSGSAHPNAQPTLVLNYIIKA